MISEVCKERDQSVDTFQNRKLTTSYSFMLVDATYLKIRENRRIVSKAFMESLKKRGLSGLKMITSDAHPGIIYAINKTFPTVAWQRCQTHFSRNVMEKTPTRYQRGFHTELLEMYNARDVKSARDIRNRIIQDYSDVAPAVMEYLDAGFESIMTVMALPNLIRRFHRTSNHIERINREIKRRSNVIGVFPIQRALYES